jgi:plastocyanin
MYTRSAAWIALFALTVVVAACGSPSPERGSAPAPAPEAAPATAPAPAAPLPGASTITGSIKFEGTAPTPRVVRMDSDPLCMVEGPGTSEVLVVGPGNGVQNTFVYVKDGLGDRTFPAPQTPVVLDQKGCKYSPHVFGAQVGQPVTVVNSDPTLHNIHAVPKTNDEFNFGQAVKGMKTTRLFNKPEVMVPFRCDVHGWMASYAGILPHPYFAVSKADGSFEIRGLPAGTYTVEAWHERLGTQTQKVTVDGKSAGTVAFAFKG